MGKKIIFLSLFGFLAVGVLLALDHPGFAIRVTNYVYFLLMAGIIYEKLA